MSWLCSTSVPEVAHGQNVAKLAGVQAPTFSRARTNATGPDLLVMPINVLLKLYLVSTALMNSSMSANRIS